MSVFIIIAVFALLNQDLVLPSITGYRPSYSGSYSQHNNKQDLKDLMNWWDHESPDWAKSSEAKVDKSDYLNYYYPNYDSKDFEYSEEQEDNADVSKRNPNVNRKPDSPKNRPGNENFSRYENRPTPVPFERITDNDQWLQSSGFQRTPRTLNNEFSGFIQNTPYPDKVITRLARQSPDSNLFAIENVPTATTALSPTVDACMKTCQTTSEYNPVCGTNNITYINHGRLACAHYCGVDVSVRRNSPCPYVSDSGINESNNAPRPLPANRPIVVDFITNTNSQSSRIQNCISNCRRQVEPAPVCGNDGRTYDSPDHLVCTQFCGVDVRVRERSACPSNNNFESNIGNNFGTGDVFESGTQSNINPNSLSIPGSNSANGIVNNLGTKPINNNAGTATNNLNADIETTTIPPHMRSCLKACPNTAEQKPVCGSNRIIYSNPARLSCARICGVDVQMRPLSFCQPATTTPIPEPLTTQSPLKCWESCHLLPEEEPVCGTNGVTYRNIAYLQCVKMCGADVEVKSYSSCQDESTTKSTSSVAVTVPNPVPESSTQINPKPSHNEINFTIPQSVLDDTFSKRPTETTTGSVILPVTTQSPLECKTSCPRSSEYKLVCGTNGVTYINIDYLQCAKMCGADVVVKSYSSCQDESTTKRTSSVAVTVAKPVPESSTQINPKPSNNEINFTISQDLLDDVFSKQPAGTTTESEIDESFIRINEK